MTEQAASSAGPAPTDHHTPRGQRARAAHRWVWVYGVIFFTFLAWFARSTPLWVPYDEIGHWMYADQLAHGMGFPYIFGAHELGLGHGEKWEFHEAHQPPVYYAALAPFAKLLGVGDIWSGDALGVLRMRLVSAVLFGGLFAFFCWRLYLLRCPDPLFAAHLWGATLLVHTQLTSIGSISNDAGVIALGTASLYFFAREKDGWWPGCVAAGLALGAKAFYVFALPGVVVAELFRARQTGVKALVMKAVWLGVCLVALGGWYFLRNQMLYGHPFATNMVEAFIAPSTMDPTDPMQLARFLKDFLNQFWSPASFVRAIGGAHVPLPYLAVCGVFTLAVVWGWAWRLLRTPWWRDRLWAVSVLGAPVGLFLIFLNSLSIYAPSGRYLLVVVPALWLCLVPLYERFKEKALWALVAMNALHVLTFAWFVARFLWPIRDEPFAVWSETIVWSFANVWPF